jgi:hypothetical protein
LGPVARAEKKLLTTKDTKVHEGKPSDLGFVPGGGW